jgi:hypothetical protein
MASTRFGTNVVAIERLDVSAYTVPSDSGKSDGTITWDKTTIVIVEATAGGVRGLGHTYADVATAQLIKGLLADVVKGRDIVRLSLVAIGSMGLNSRRTFLGDKPKIVRYFFR